MTTRLRMGIVSLVALAGLVVMASFAGAAKAGQFEEPALVGFDPEDANVPYLAWRGEKVRLVKCETPAGLGFGGIDDPDDITGANAVIEDWSGDEHQRPQFESTGGLIGPEILIRNFDNVAVFEGQGEMAGRICFATTLISQKAGIAIVKLSVSGVNAAGQPTMLMQHQFTVAWMNLQTTNVEDIGPSTVPAAAPPAAVCETFQEDPQGNDRCVAFVEEATPASSAAAGNQIQVTVTGTIPLGNNFAEWNTHPAFAGIWGGTPRAATTPLTMPQDWDEWAQIWARSSIAGHERNPCLWDIHDEFTGVPGGAVTPVAGDNHNAAPADGFACVIGPSAPGRDEVDAPGGNEIGPFTRFVHQFADDPVRGPQPVVMPAVTAATIGPFDPKRRDTSYIPDGFLNQGDAPMPAARVDVRINAAGPGLLVPIDKHWVYGTQITNQVHPLWAPYYASFIPSTAAQRAPNGPLNAQNQNAGLGTTASGIDGPATGNNFHGFLNNFAQGGLYHFWDFAVATGRLGTNIINPITRTPCPPFAPGFAAQTPSGFTDVTVYTDEHGEARVGFAGGLGFAPTAGQVQFNANGGCDLLSNALGSNVISAIARYPYQPVTSPDVPGDETVPKAVVGQFAKTITCVPKGPGLPNQVAFICTATAIGLNNQPFVGEPVCFITDAEAIMAAPGFTELTAEQLAAIRGPLGTPLVAPRGAAVLCVATNARGQASVEIFGKGSVNVIAFFMQEGLLRFVQLSPPTTVPVPSGTQPATQPVTSTQPPTQAQVVSLGASTTPVQPTTTTPAKANAVKLVSSRVVLKKGVKTLVVRVNSPNKKAKIKVVMRGKRKTVATAVRTVRTNRAVTVPNLRIAKTVNRVTVSVIR